jgi:hypothetical protein
MIMTLFKKFPGRLLSLGLLTVLVSPSVALADPFVMQNDLQMWQIGSARFHISKRIWGYLDVQNNEVNLTSKANLSPNKTHYSQLVVRPAIGFQVNKYMTLWQGYGWTPSFQPKFRNENQIWEQISLERKFENLHNLTLSSRNRLEIRRIADAGGTSLRYRNQLRASLPLGHSRWSLVVYDEPFINLNTVGNGPRSGFNQNWLFVGLNRKITKSLSAEVGYLNNYVNNPRSSTDRMNHVIMISMSIVPGFSGIDLKRKRIDEPRPRLERLFRKQNTSQSEREGDQETRDLLTVEPEKQELFALDAPLVEKQPDLEVLPITREQ